jgi:diguanylate cyclase (GGDEF)-like protein
VNSSSASPALPEPVGRAVASVTELAQLRLMALGFDQVREGVAVFDTTKALVYANSAFVETRAGTLDELIGRSLDSFLPAAVGAMVAVEITTAPLHLGGDVLVGHVMSVRDVSERNQLTARLARAATHDPLTDLPNRHSALEAIEDAIDAQRATGRQVAALFVDIDSFASVNARHGEDAGNEVLFTIAGRITRSIRDTDSLARVGDDEFVVLLRDIMGDDAPIKTADRILAAVGAPFYLGASVVKVSVSVGIAVTSSDSDSARTLLHKADLAMCEAKLVGPGRIAMNTS